MASRKSSRIKKSPVVYQAPEPVHRARNVTPKQIQPRRSFSRDIELQMECVEDELSPAQLKAIKEAQKEHEKANDLIKEVRAGNILVPSAQPNTFTIVPPKSTQQQPKPQQQQQQKGIVSVQVPIIKAPSPPVDISASRGLPPPRPAQFLNKQLQEIHKTQAAKSADVILIDDVSVSAAVQVPQVAMLPAQGASATPQQMYKFVSLPSSMPTNMIQNQWALRPLLTVSPQQQHQQQQQHVFLTAGLTQFSPVGTVAMQLGQGQMSAPRSTNVSGKELDKIGDKPTLEGHGRSKPPSKKDVRQYSTLLHKPYLKQCGKGSYKSWVKRIRFSGRGPFCPRSKSAGTNHQIVSERVPGLTKRSAVENNFQSCDKGPKCAYKHVVLDSYCEKNSVEMMNAHIVCDILDSNCKHTHKSCKCEKVNEEEMNGKDHSEKFKLPLEVFSDKTCVNRAYRSVFQDYLTSCHSSQKSHSATQHRQLLKALGQIDNRAQQSEPLRKFTMKPPAPSFKMKKVHVPKGWNDKNHRCEGRKVGMDKEKMTKCLKLKPFKQKKELRNKSWWRKKLSLNELASHSEEVRKPHWLSKKQTFLSPLYERVDVRKIQRNSGIVNMIYETTKCMFADSNKVVEEYSSTQESRSCEASVLVCDVAEEIDGKKAHNTFVDSKKALRERCQNISFEQKESLPETEDFIAGKEKSVNVKNGCDISKESSKSIIEDKMQARISEIGKDVEVNGNNLNQEDLDESVLQKKGMSKEETAETVNSLLIEQTDKTRDSSEDADGSWSYSGDISSGEEGENGTEEEISFGAQKPVKDKWYHKLSERDALCVCVLCQHYGFTKMSRDLQIPKTELLKLRRLVRKSKYHQALDRFNTKGQVDERRSCEMMFSSDVFDTKKVAPGQAEQSYIAASALQKYHQELYDVAQQLLSQKHLKQEGESSVANVIIGYNESKSKPIHLCADDQDIPTACESGDVILIDQPASRLDRPGVSSQNESLSLMSPKHKINKKDHMNTNEDSVPLGVDSKSQEKESRKRLLGNNESIVTAPACGSSELLTDFDKSVCCKTDIFKHRKSSQELLENSVSKIRTGETGKLPFNINHDHCYLEKMPSTGIETSTENVPEDEENTVADSENSLHPLLSKCFALPENSLEEVDGRKLNVYSQPSEDRLKEILLYASRFGLNLAASHFSIPKEHIQTLVNHALSHSEKVNKSDCILSAGIPEDYVSSFPSHRNSLASFYQGVNDSVNSKDCEPVSDDSVNSKVCAPVSDDSVNSKDCAPVSDDSVNSKDCAPVSDLSTDKEEIVPFNILTEDGIELPKVIVVDKADVVSGKIFFKEHQIYTTEFLKYALKNRLFMCKSMLTPQEKVTEVNKLVNLCDLENNVRTFTTKKGKVVHRYSPDFVRRMLVLAHIVGLKVVSEVFKINMETIHGWKKKLEKAMVTFCEQNKNVEMPETMETTKDGKVFIKRVLFRRKGMLSADTKIKLVHLCKKFGVAKVARLYNFKGSTLRTWMKFYSKDKLQNYELTSKDLVKIFEYVSSRQEITEDEHNKICMNRPDSSDENSLFVICQGEKTDEFFNSQLSTSDIDEKQISWNKQEYEAEKNSEEKDARVSANRNSTVKSPQMTCPNNMEVILGIEDESESDDDGEIKKSECFNSESLKETIRPNDNYDLENVNHEFRGCQKETRTKSTDSFESTDSSVELTVNQAVDQKSYWETVKNDETFHESDTYVEIISWDVTNKNEFNENVFNVNLDTEQAQTQYPHRFNKETTLNATNQNVEDFVERLEYEKDSLNKKHFNEMRKKQPDVNELTKYGGTRLDKNSVSENTDKSVFTSSIGTTCKKMEEEKHHNIPGYPLQEIEHCVKNSHRLRNQSLSENVTADATSSDAIFISDGEESCPLQHQLLSASDIKEEPQDDEFDKIEKGWNYKVKKEEHVSRNENYRRRRSTAQGRGEKDYIADGKGKEVSKSCEINQLGIGDGNRSESQGYTFQSSSGNNQSSSQGSASSNVSGTSGSSDFSVGSLPVSGADIQIVGTQDLIPGQEYILLDPRLFNTGSDTFPAIRPPTLHRPQIRHLVNTSNSVMISPQVSTVSALSPGVPTPVHMVENRSVRTNTSLSTTQVSLLTPPAPRLTLYGNAGPSREAQEGELTKNATVRSLLAGIRDTSNCQGKVVHSNTVSLPSSKITSSGKSVINTSTVKSHTNRVSPGGSSPTGSQNVFLDKQQEGSFTTFQRNLSPTTQQASKRNASPGRGSINVPRVLSTDMQQARTGNESPGTSIVNVSRTISIDMKQSSRRNASPVGTKLNVSRNLNTEMQLADKRTDRSTEGESVHPEGINVNVSRSKSTNKEQASRINEIKVFVPRRLNTGIHETSKIVGSAVNVFKSIDMAQTSESTEETASNVSQNWNTNIKLTSMASTPPTDVSTNVLSFLPKNSSTLGNVAMSTSPTNPEKETKQSLTLGGIGSISNKNLVVSCTSKGNDLSILAEGNDKVQKELPIGSGGPPKPFPKDVANSTLLLEKERKLLRALLLEKSKRKTPSVAAEFTTITPLEIPEETSQQIQSSNRITSLIQKMTDRFQRSTENLNLQSPLSESDGQKTNASDGSSKPASASEILFGENASPKKKEVSSLKTDQGLSSGTLNPTFLLTEEDTAASWTKSSGLVKRDQRKTPLVVRELDSTEDESSSSSYASENSSTSTASSERTTEPKDGRIEQVDLSEKLKSLLSADIFNVIEPQKHDDEDDDDLTEILSKTPDKRLTLGGSPKQREHSGSIKSREDDGNRVVDEEPVSKKMEDVKGESKEIQKKKAQTKVTYSVNIKKKLGKLASMFSIASLSKKYGITSKTLAAWKAKYQDEEIAGLQLTNAELRELEDINKLKVSLYGATEPEYDIYVDNPEEDECVSVIDITGSQEVEGEIARKIASKPAEPSRQELVKSKSSLENKLTAKLKSDQRSTSKPLGLSKGNAMLNTPLYICIENDTSDEVKQQLREKIRRQKTSEEVLSNGASLKSAKSSLVSVFGHSETNSEGELKKSLPLGCTDGYEKLKSGAADENVMVNVDLQEERHTEKELQKTSAENVTWEKTVYLCPDQGVFKYRYEMKKDNTSSSSLSKTKENLSVLDSLFKSPHSSPMCEENAQMNLSEKPVVKQNMSLEPSEISNLLRETHTKSVTQSADKFVPEKSFPTDQYKIVTSLRKPYSEDFKWNVVKEARLSGFENTAKMYNISMTDIMKWHDSFLDERKSKECIAVKTQPGSATQSSSSIVDLTETENEHTSVVESNLAGIPGKGRLGKINANLSFERISVKEGTITKPRFNSKAPAIQSTLSAAFTATSRPQRTRMGPNSIKYATPKVDPEQLVKFHADVQGDLGIMPKIMKKAKSKQDGVEIASTWKQVQSVLNPVKNPERKYSQEFKNKIIKECEQKGQKTVAHEHRIPYNEISRWRLEAKRTSSGLNLPRTTSGSDLLPKSASSFAETPKRPSSKKVVTDSSKEQSVLHDKNQQSEQESLKIKIKLSSLSQASSSSLSSKKTGLEKKSDMKDPDTVQITHELATTARKMDKLTRSSSLPSRESKDSGKSEVRYTLGTERTKSIVRAEPVSIDEDVDLRMEVINFCLEQGVLKTQKKYNVTRQSIIDLMKEYDELNKYAVDSYNRSQELHSFKTRLVSREKTSVEVTNTASQPVIVKNLNDYIVTQEYMQSVVDYALKHGITAATRKFKRKTSTVRSWINQFQRESKKKISVEQIAKEQELLAKNMSIEEARSISNLEARKKKQLLEAEFRRHIVEFAREFGITAASRRFKKKAATVKSWMGHCMKFDRDAKRLEEAEARKKLDKEQDSTKSPRASSPKPLTIHLDSASQKSPSSSKQKTPPQSPIWEQDFVIKPSSSKSPLKLTFSPRRKSSPVIVIGSSTEEDNVDDETNDIETDDEQLDTSGDYVEVVAWDIDSGGSSIKTCPRNLEKNKKSIVNLEDGDHCATEKAIDTVTDLTSENNTLLSKNTSYEWKERLFQEKTANIAINSTEICPANAEDTATEGKQSLLSQPGEGSSEAELFISPMDVPNIFDSDEILVGNEPFTDKETMNDKTDKEMALQEMKSHTEEGEIFDVNKPETESKDEGVKLPYEETVMFKLLTDEVDSFIKGDAKVVKYKGNEAALGRQEEKPDMPDVKKDGKLGPIKKFKKYADAEIMQNIEETYLFTGSRVTRQAANKEVETNADSVVTNKDHGVGNISDSGSVKGENKSDLEAKKNGNETESNVKHEESNCDKVEMSGNDMTMQPGSLQLNDRDEKTDIGTDSKDSPKKVVRSLFDMLGTGSKDSENTVSDDSTVSHLDSVEKTDTKHPSLGLFGSLMKSMKIPEAGEVKGTPVAIDISSSEEPASTSVCKEMERSEKSESNKDRTERNLFDFIGLDPEPVKPIPAVPSAVSQSPRIQTRSFSKTVVEPVKSSQNPSKTQPFKKPMFKFPKLASQINFGNIAKLGLAKLKEGEKAKESQTCVKDEDKVVTEDKAQDGTADSEKNKSESEKQDGNDVVMETFEQLRQRLAKERAASRLEKEKAKACQDSAVATDIDEIDGSRVVDSDISAPNSSEIVDEMYKDFAPQKIVLILDISKKHGIEFASTSFGLPVSVIVNWIIEKDRKQRKAALSVSLEEKMKALKDLKEGIVSRETVKERYSIDEYVLNKWDCEAGWLLENKSVRDILEKWQKVETVSNINFEECAKNLERKDSVTEKDKNEEDVNYQETEKVPEAVIDNTSSEDSEVNLTQELSEESMINLPISHIDKEIKAESEVAEEKDSDTEVVVSHVEKPSDAVDDKTTEATEAVTEQQTTENKEESTEDKQTELPDILSFVKTTKTRDFNIEQKAMFVLLVQKYGNQTICKKFGINSGTLHNWGHTSKPVRQYLYEQTGSKLYYDESSSREAECKKVSQGNQSETNQSYYLPMRETRSAVEQKQNVLSNKRRTFTETNSSPKITETGTSKSEEKMTASDELVENPKGYRIISPTKLPPVLRDLKKKCPTKDYTLEQKVAIVKLVQLYGVRTIHKQFHIPTGSIWNWQHAKNIIELVKAEDKSCDRAAQKVLDFNEEEECQDKEEPVNIDTILDRVLITADTTNHLNYKQDQKADVVCLINHFGIDYFCEKVPHIPRGTLWNWRHNRHVEALVEDRNRQIEMFSAKLSARKGNGLSESVVSEAVDKSDLTQKWVKDLQVNVTGRKGYREFSVESLKRKNLELEEIGLVTKKPKLGPMSYKRTLPTEKVHRSMSPSSISSEISVHSNDFEEILSEDETNTPSVVSRRSGASTQTVQSNKTGSVQRTSKGSASGRPESRLSSQFTGIENEKSDETPLPVYEVVKCESGPDNRMMVCYKVLENKDAPASQPVKSTESAGKRSAQSEPASAQPPAKKKTLKATDVPDQSGNWVPLDEYYYGTHDGDTTYTEEKGEYRFKCWYCSKMLYNNVRAMQHIQGHIDASKQQNIDLSDLTQCKHCYKQFDTPFEMQTHVEKVHLSNKVLMCRICEKDFATPRELMAHMKSNHHAMEMPYMCHLCHFRSSMYSDVVDHFKKKHDSSHYLLCLYCLRTFEVKFVSQGWGQTQTYYGHLLKHQSKSSTKKCVVCRLTFFNSGDVKNHRRTCHVTSFSDVIASSHGSRSDSAQKQKKGSTLKSLNAPSISRIQDYGDITFPAQTSSSKCIECKMMMSSTDHYKKYVHCSMCRFATSCSVAYANHMMGFHSGQMSSLNLNIPWERPMKQVMYCSCGYSSKYGNKVANHLVYCAKWTCSSKKQEQTSTAKREAGEKEKEGSLLGMLGLVQKSTVATTDEDQSEIRSIEKPKSNAKLETKVVGQVREVKHPKDLKLDTKPIDEDMQEISDSDTLKRQKDKQRNVEALTKDAISTEISEAFSDMTSEEVKKSDSEEMPQKGRNKSEHNVTEIADIKENIDSNTGGSSMEVSKNLEEAMPDKNTEVLKEEKSEKGQNDVEKKIDSETDKNLQKPAVDKNKELMDTEESEVIELDTHVKSSQDKAECAMEDKLEEMDTVLVEKPTDVSEDSSIENNTTSKQPQETSESIEKMDKSLSEVSAKSEEKTKEIKNTSENMKQENDLKGEGKEMCQENVVDTEMELDSQGPSKESKEMDLENNDENQSKLNETVSKNLSTDDSSVKNENIGSEDEGETREEETEDMAAETEDMTDETEDMADDQKSAETADRETGSKDDADRELGSKDGKPAMEEKEKKGTDSESMASEALGDSDHSSSMSKDQDDHLESSEAHSGKRTESDERRHTGDKSKHDDRPHDAERRHRDNRSHSSSRSDSHHGNRSGSDAHRDRDRSHDRDRSRDYNRNRDYTYSDNRSGYSYQDNRGQGYTGGHGYRGSQGQHGGYHGNRGDHSQNRNRGGHHQDRNYNRNYQNRGGYNQNYRGGYRGGYY